jgi:GxxExxY protein
LEDLNQLTEKIIGCAIEVHRNLGPALLEATYEEAMCIELTDAHINYQKQLPFPILYKRRTLGEYRLDLLVEDSVIVEVKSVERFDPIRSSSPDVLKGNRQENRSSDKFPLQARTGRDQKVCTLSPRPLCLSASVAKS